MLWLFKYIIEDLELSLVLAQVHSGEIYYLKSGQN